MEKAKKYFNNQKLPADVWSGKYALEDIDLGEQVEETPDQMHRRLSSEFARVEKTVPPEDRSLDLSVYGRKRPQLTEDLIFDWFADFDGIIPQGSIMSLLGNPYQVGVLSNCVVVPPAVDSYGGIMYADQTLAQLMKRRAGVGLDISKLRPQGATVRNAAKTSSGAVSFMDRFSSTTNEVAQKGRRGALMLTIDCRHPDLEAFIRKKEDLSSVSGANISVKWRDEFVRAANNGDTYTLRWPVDAEPEEAEITKEVDAKRLYNQAAKSAWESGDPGCMFIDRMNDYSTDYGYPGLEVTTTNPCFSGDTKIAVADGRDAVTIRELAEEGKDVDVYAVNPETGNVEIKRGRNPRVTGYDKKLLRISFGRFGKIEVTPDHTFPLKNGEKKRADELEEGDALMAFSKRAEWIDEKKNAQYYRVTTNTLDSSQRVFEHRLIARYNKPEKWDRMYDRARNELDWEHGGVVVHHRDYDPLNNDPDNLELMLWEDHNRLHAEEISTSGENNGKWSGHDRESLEAHGITLFELLGRPFTYDEWQTYADNNGLPKSFSDYRQCDEYATIGEFARYCAQKSDARAFDGIHSGSIQKYMSALEQGYNADFDERGRVIVERECEECGKTFWVPVGRREQSFCGHECVAKNIAGSGVEASLETKKSEAQKKREAQLEVFAELEFELGREPKLSEWKERCAEKGIPKRLRTKYGFDDFADLKKNAMAYNHKVNSVEEVEGRHTVYNITVDDHHTVATVTKEYDNKHGNPNFNGVFAYQCGEIGMPPNDTCRLIAPNLFSAVRNPFEGNAEIDFDYLYRMYYEGQRLSDDLVTLEIEYMQRVLQKINEDDEAERYKRTERNIWRDLIESARKYRRTGLGFTALGDTLAAMGVRYGSEEAERMTNLIMRTKIKGEWDASIDMAIERGPFPEWRPEHDDTEFFDMLEEEFPTLYERNMEHGRRNISLSTVAPTGSVSLLAKIGDSYGTSSGIEPVFTTEPLKLWHTRRRRTNPGEEPDYVDENDNEWIEYTVFHSGVKEWAKAQDIDLTSHGYNEESGLVEDEEAMKDLLAESPYNGATSSELDAKDRIDLQAVVQKYTTHSISSTLNLPNDCPEDRVREIYEYAHEAGLKGVTVFRDGSKSGVLADSGGSSGFDYHDAPERPERLECKIHKLRRNGDNWKIFVGMYEDKPYEVFACKASMRLVDSDNHAFDKGYIDKHGEGVYSLVAPDEKVVLEDIAARMPSPEIEALTRMISMALRHGAKMDWIVEQLDKAEGSVASFSKALSTVLMEHMEEPVTCSECGSEDVSFQEGCLTCRSCGASKCG